jgi:APA family basic amino acid/polyamine antiporter
MVFFKKAAQLNEAKVPAWSIWMQCFGLQLFVLRVNMVIYLILWYIVLIFYILILEFFILRKKMPNAERPYKAFLYPYLPALYYSCFNLCGFALYKNSTSGWGVLIMLLGILFII